MDESSLVLGHSDDVGRHHFFVECKKFVDFISIGYIFNGFLVPEIILHEFYLVCSLDDKKSRIYGASTQ